MLTDDRDGLRAYRFSTLPEEVDALVSTRWGGLSEGPYTSLNLGLRVGDDPDAVLANRRRLFENYALPLERSAWCRQIHKEFVTVVDADLLGPTGQRGAFTEDDIIVDTDALVTAMPDTPLCVTLADCVPVVIYDPAVHVLGLAHAGWGGTVARISSKTVAVMSERFGSDPETLIAAIGPSIAPADYEVGADVIDAARTAYGDDADQLLIPGAEGKAQFDLWTANATDLAQAGVPKAAIEIAGISTAGALDTFFSHRAEHGRTGRLIAAAMLRPRP